MDFSFMNRAIRGASLALNQHLPVRCLTLISCLSSGDSSPVTVRNVKSANRSERSSNVGMKAAHGLRDDY